MSKEKKKSKVKIVLGRLGICLGTLVGVILVVAVAALMVLYYGPSTSARDKFVLSIKETSAGGFLADLFLPKSTVDAIIDGNKLVETDETTDTSMIQIPDSVSKKGQSGETGDDDDDDDYDINKIELIDIEGKTYNGKLLIVYNPKRVFIGTPEAYGEDKAGVSTLNMVKNANALYGVNGGGFYDTGSGNGGIPTGRENSPGIVISNGELMWGYRNSTYEIIGINKDGVLVLGKMTAQQALDQGIVEAINFGPYLIVNGEPVSVSGYSSSGLNPRTAIGQRADGAILILTIDGRQPTSIGASYEDLIEVMMRYGAVNAANLDGGSSTYLAQNSETENNPKIITQCASLYGPRKMATSILVAKITEDGEIIR